MDKPIKPVKSTTPATDFPQLLAMADEFRLKCSGILLGQDGIFFLDMEITAKLSLLIKLPTNPNDAVQHQLCFDIVKHIEKLNIHLQTVGRDHPDEFNKLQREPYYQHLEIIKQGVLTHQQTAFPHLHSARQLTSSLQQLKKFDPKEYGAMYHLLMALEKTFFEKDLPAADKLKMMMQQISDAHHAIKNTLTTHLPLFGAKPKPNPLAAAIETFIKEDMTHIAELNGITPFTTPTNTSRNPSVRTHQRG